METTPVRILWRISDPLLDRINLHIEVPLVEFRELTSTSGGGEKSSVIRERVMEARRVQLSRFKRAPNRGSLDSDHPERLSKRPFFFICRIASRAWMIVPKGAARVPAFLSSPAVATILEQLKFKGPVGLQHYGIKGDVRTNLQRSIQAWRNLTGS